MIPFIYLAQTPATAHERRVLRARALDLHARLSQIDEGPCVALLNVGLQGGEAADLVVLRPRSVIVGVIRQVEGPIDVLSDGRWVVRGDGTALLGPQRETPIETVRRAREALRPMLQEALERERQQGETSSARQAALGTVVGALVVAPTVHPESRVRLDVEDHRQRIKLLGLDELAPLASMLQAGAQLDEAAMRGIAGALGGRLWHDGERLLFEIGRAPYQLRVLGDGGQLEHTLPLLEGANVVGRRVAPLQHEYRLTLEGDDSMSADHAIIVCGTDGRVLLRDTSTNGSRVLLPNGDERRVHRSDSIITVGTTIQMGETVLRLERVD